MGSGSGLLRLMSVRIAVRWGWEDRAARRGLREEEGGCWVAVVVAEVERLWDDLEDEEDTRRLLGL